MYKLCFLSPSKFMFMENLIDLSEFKTFFDIADINSLVNSKNSGSLEVACLIYKAHCIKQKSIYKLFLLD